MSFRAGLLALVVGIAASVLVWDSGDTTSNAGCLTCVSAVDCSQVVGQGVVCNASQGCTCQFVQGCGNICTN